MSINVMFLLFVTTNNRPDALVVFLHPLIFFDIILQTTNCELLVNLLLAFFCVCINEKRNP